MAVGFTPGDPGPGQPGPLPGQGRHAHAWPEVYLGRYGWVPFEPTPAAGPPTPQSYTDVPEQQATPDARPTTTLPANGSSTTTPDAGSVDAEALARQFGDLGTGGGGTLAEKSSPWPGRLAVLGLMLVGLTLGYLLAVPSVLASRRLRRRSAAAGDPAARVRVAWLESAEAVSLAGTTRHADETSREFADRAGERLPDQEAGFATLAVANDAAVFGAGGVDEGQADEAEEIRRSVHGAVSHEVSLPRRVLSWLDVRRIWRP